MVCSFQARLAIGEVDSDHLSGAGCTGTITFTARAQLQEIEETEEQFHVSGLFPHSVQGILPTKVVSDNSGYRSVRLDPGVSLCLSLTGTARGAAF